MAGPPRWMCVSRFWRASWHALGVYSPVHFKPDRATERDLLSRIDAGNLITSTDRGLLATFLPVLIDVDAGPHGVVLAHLARNNDQWQVADEGEALFIADIIDGYVSPSWYPSKAEHGRVVPTWNYIAVHLYGTLVVHDDSAWVESMVRRLTARHESRRADPWTVDDAPREYVEGQIRAIVGVEVLITRVEAKVKMSQNRPSADIDGVVAGAIQQEQADLAEWVRRSAR
jgi:transcriptional regulator